MTYISSLSLRREVFSLWILINNPLTDRFNICFKQIPSRETTPPGYYSTISCSNLDKGYIYMKVVETRKGTHLFLFSVRTGTKLDLFNMKR